MKIRHLISGTLLSLLFAANVFSAGTPWYSDVEIEQVYRDAIYLLTQRDYIEGYTDGTFKPMNPISRAEAIKIIMKSSESLPEANLSTPLDFPDLDKNAWYISYIEDAFERGIVAGNDDGTFNPDGTINRAEALKIFSIANNIELPEAQGPWYQKYLNYGIENDLIVPNWHGEYVPESELTRGELCDIIYRHLKNPFTGEVEHGKATWYAGRFEGDSTANGETFGAENLTAAHKTLPFGTMVRITNLDNNLSVDVRINDRGPYRDGYIIDLSSAAFEKIGSLGTGVLNVRLEVLNQ
ncbi:septal ring lytic transglycosylase RlpA family protein [Patescibacteria group bacterium]|nr:septal ring lytic transglycosylase RlpA family protein [Patescibacteria group bacterium]